jgi:hypothetical protein
MVLVRAGISDSDAVQETVGAIALLVAARILKLAVGVVDSLLEKDVVMDMLVVVVMGMVRLSVMVAPLWLGSVAVVDKLSVHEAVIVAVRGDGERPVEVCDEEAFLTTKTFFS